MVTPESRAASEPRWDAKDVAAYLKVSRSWVYQAAESGELPCVRIGALLRFDPEIVRAYGRGEKPQAAEARVLTLGRVR